MSAPLSRIIEGLKVIQRRGTPRGMIKADFVAREAEGRFLLDMVTDAIEILERTDDDDE